MADQPASSSSAASGLRGSTYRSSSSYDRPREYSSYSHGRGSHAERDVAPAHASSRDEDSSWRRRQDDWRSDRTPVHANRDRSSAYDWRADVYESDYRRDRRTSARDWWSDPRYAVDGAGPSSASSWQSRGRGRGRGRGGLSRSHLEYSTAWRSHDAASSEVDDHNLARHRRRHTGEEDQRSGKKAVIEADEVRIDWQDVQKQAREKGLAVPSDLVDEFKQKGHFDSLRRQMFRSFQASPYKDEFLTAMSKSMLLRLETSNDEVIRIAQMGDVRLQQPECMRLLDLEDLTKTRSSHVQGGQGEGGPGENLLANLLKRLYDESGGTNAPVCDMDGMLSPSGSIGSALRDGIQTLLNEEVRDKDKVLAILDRNEEPTKANGEEQEGRNGLDNRNGASEQQSQIRSAAPDTECVSPL